MRNKLLVAAILASATFMVGCGSSSSGSDSDENYSATYTTDGVTYTCNTEAAFKACTEGNDCSSCTNDAPAPVASPEPSTTPQSTECETSGSTVLVNEGTTCTDGANTLSCSENRVTLNNSITGGTININGKTYTCQ